MKHYFNPMSRGATTAWMLNELEAPHEQVVLDFASGATKTPEFRSINPMGKLPTLVDGDMVVTETAAICRRAFTPTTRPDSTWPPLRMTFVSHSGVTESGSMNCWVTEASISLRR